MTAGHPAPVGSGLLAAVAVMDRLRSPGGCPWDAEQTHASLVEYLIEETYETVEAIETGDDAHLREELGDLLLQVLFHARIAQEQADAPWSVDDVAGDLVAKLVARHPHVFGDVDGAVPTVQAVTAQEVEDNWQRLKTAEKARESVTDGIPIALPSLVLAAKLLSRAAKGGVAVSLAPQAVSLADSTYEQVADEGQLGDLLLALVAGARTRGLDADVALRDSLRRQRAAIRATEGLAD